MDKEIELKVQEQSYFEAAVMVAKLTEENELLRYDLKIADEAYDEVIEKYSELVTDTNYDIMRLKEEVERSYHKGRSEGEEIGYEMGYDEGYKEGLRER